MNEPYLRFRNGNILHFLNPEPQQILIDDIAWHLARTCRFNGSMNVWYSNAEHSILGARKATDLEVSRAFLIHDAGEYVYGDLPSPVKNLCPDYKARSDKFQDFIYRHYLGKLPDENEVKLVDQRMTATEMKYLRKGSNLHAEPYEDMSFYCWNWEEAYHRYLEMFYWLFPEHK